MKLHNQWINPTQILKTIFFTLSLFLICNPSLIYSVVHPSKFILYMYEYINVYFILFLRYVAVGVRFILPLCLIFLSLLFSLAVFMMYYRNETHTIALLTEKEATTKKYHFLFDPSFIATAIAIFVKKYIIFSHTFHKLSTARQKGKNV